MNAQEAYNTHLPTINGIADEKVVTPRMPTEEIIVEAEKLVLVAQRDRESLVAAGLDALYIDSLNERIGAFAFASTAHMLMVDNKTEEQEAWQKEEEKGYELQRELLHSFRFAYRRDETILKKVSRISAGRGRKDMILDLLALYQVGSAHTEPLTKVGFDMALLEQAKTQFELLSNMFATVDMDIDEVRDIKNRAHTWLYKAMSEIRDHGKFVFWKDEERHQEYISEFLSISRKKGS